MTKNSVVPIGGELASRKGASLPAVVSDAIVDILITFSAGNQDDTDKKRVVRVYQSAVADFHSAVAEAGIAWIMRHNPRNPFRPTAQDVYEACEMIAAFWKQRVIQFFFEDGVWHHERIKYERHDPRKGPEPLNPGCMVPDELVLKHLTDKISFYEAEILAKLGRKRLLAIPKECFLGDKQQEALQIASAPYE